jgi:hypothetical protein
MCLAWGKIALKMASSISWVKTGRNTSMYITKKYLLLKYCFNRAKIKQMNERETNQTKVYFSGQNNIFIFSVLQILHTTA